MKDLQKEALRFTAYGYLFPEIGKPRNQRRSLQILEGAISVYAKYGVQNATDQLVAEAAGVSRPLIFRYFKNREALFQTATKYVRVNFQQFAISYIEKEKNVEDILRAYVISTLRWTEEFPDHASLLIFFLYSCCQNNSEKIVNTNFTEAGHQRITTILQLGVQQKLIHCENPLATAKMIQTVVTGGVITWLSEELPMGKSAYEKWLINTCLSIAGFSTQTKG
ncbi:MAG: TetR/AcrR family transcriptional regulator [Pseudobdellovibrionaceae bacterium]